MTPPFLNEKKLYEDFHKECFYKEIASAYEWQKQRRIKKVPYDIAHFRIVRSRGYSFEWWKDYIGVVFYGVMNFHKSEHKFQFLHHVTPLSLQDDHMLEGKIIDASALELADSALVHTLLFPEPKQVAELPQYNKWEERLLRFKQQGQKVA